MKIRICGLATVAAIALSVSAAWAGPSISRGEQLLGGDEASCMAHARNAFVSEGWNVLGGGGTYIAAGKGAFSAYITCNASARGGVVVNVFVASSNVPDNIPGDPAPDHTGAGAQRVALQLRMQ